MRYLFIAAFLLLCLPNAIAEHTVLLDTGFEDGLDAWGRAGNAVFSLDETNARTGARCAHITVPPEAPLQYQHFEYRFGPVQPGDTYELSVLVRAEGIHDGTGAYAALEFLDAEGKRAGLFQSITQPATGTHGWEQLHIEGRASSGAASAGFHLLLNSHGDAWFDDARIVFAGRIPSMPDLGAAPRAIRVDAASPIRTQFGGVGFHVFCHLFPAPEDYLNTVLAKRWRELDPSFARVTDLWDWDDAMREQAATHFLRLKDDTNTEIYLTTWNPKVTQPGDERAAYAARIADNLAYYIQEKGCTNIKMYCMTNELSLEKWGSLMNDLPTFADYHRELYKAFAARGIDVRLLATDASPVSYWHSIEWAAENMDDVTGVYGGHHYNNEFALDDLNFYPWFLGNVARVADLAQSKGKPFILGEFGAKQDGRTVDGKYLDNCVYWDTPNEPLAALQVAEMVLAAINGGGYAMGYWTFVDFPDNWNPHRTNKWGTFRRGGDDNSTRASYYSHGLLTKFFRGPASSLHVETSDPRLRAAAVHQDSGAISVAVINRSAATAPVTIALENAAPDKPFRKYVYDTANVPRNPFGDLQPPSAVLPLEGNTLHDTLGPDTLTVYTTAYDDDPPAPAAHLTAKRQDADTILTWEPSPSADLCYYRLYRVPANEPPTLDTAHQIVSTIATAYTEKNIPSGEWRYTVVPVDRSGNAGEACSVNGEN